MQRQEVDDEMMGVKEKSRPVQKSGKTPRTKWVKMVVRGDTTLSI